LSRLTDIPIRIEPRTPLQPRVPGESPLTPGGLGGGVTAILFELVGHLERLAHDKTSATIDLRSLPMSPKDRVELQRALGEGEVQATVTASGLSNIRETRVPGVWWVEHRDRDGELIAELIEVTRVPEFLTSATDEIASGARNLREQITTRANAPPRVEN
jgi:hydrogenase-1 operon protein HyaF